MSNKELHDELNTFVQLYTESSQLLAKEVLEHEKTKKELSKLKSQIKKLKANKVKS